MTQFKNNLLACAAALMLTSSVEAHTISLGSFNAGAPGSVTIALGTYDHGGPVSQGQISLIAGPGIGAPVISSFSSVLLSSPAGLTDGVNNFYAEATPALYGGLPSDSFTSPTNVSGLGPVVNWMTATFTGLSAGSFTYQLSGLTSANWENINSFQTNWTGTVVIPQQTVTGQVPEGGSSIVVLGLAVAATAGLRRKFGI